MKSRMILPALIAVGCVAVLFLPADAFAQTVDIDALDTTCIATDLKNCVVMNSGRINKDGGDDTGAPMLAWQTQTGFTDTDGTLGGFVVLTHKDGAWSVLDSGFDGYRFEPPRIGMDGALLHFPGYSGGTGAYNVDRLYLFGDTGAAVYREDWQQIDIETWRDSIGDKLPKGLEIWKGVDFDFADWFYGEMNARTPLWKPDDGNCCPTGGEAIIHFEIDEAEHILVATGVTLIPRDED